LSGAIAEARVTAAWEASYDPALKVARGEALTLGGTDPEFPGWRWCVNAGGLGGWLPETLLDGDRAGEDFDTAELKVSPGDTVTLLDARAGWWRCRKADGREGWLPEDVLDTSAS
jgi:SH3-like domain-containing protein